MERSLAVAGTVSGVGAAIGQVIPAVPDGFGSWQPVAILGFICVVCLAVLFWLLKTVFQTLSEQSKNLGTLATSIGEQSRRSDELCCKQGELVKALEVNNAKQADLVSELQRRPCIKGK